MTSVSTIFTGIMLITSGMAAGGAAVHVYQQRLAQTKQADAAPFIEQHSTYAKAEKRASQFKPEAQSNAPDARKDGVAVVTASMPHTVNATNTTIIQPSTTQPIPKVDKLTGYNDLLAALQFISHASEEQLAKLAFSLETTVLSQETHTVARALFQRWAQINFNSAFFFVQQGSAQQAQTTGTSKLLSIALTVLSETAPDTMLDWAAQLEIQGYGDTAPWVGGTIAERQAGVVFETLAREDPTIALFSLVSADPDFSNPQAVGRILGEWGKHNPEAAWYWLNDNDSTGVLDQFRQRILQHWLINDSVAALPVIDSLPENSLKHTLLKNHATSLAATHPQQALQWASTLTSKTSRQLAMDAVVYRWASDKPKQVAEHINAMLDPEARRQLLHLAGPAITSGLTSKDPRQAMDWANTLSLDAQSRVKPMIFQQWVNRDAVEAMNWFRSQGNIENADDYLATVAPTLPYQNLTLAMDLFPVMSETVKMNMVAPIALRLYQRNTEATQQWIDSLPDVNLRHKANLGLLYSSIQSDPVTALLMAENYQGADRQVVLRNTAIEVDQQNPGMIGSWLRSATLSEVERSLIQLSLEIGPHLPTGPIRANTQYEY